MNPKFVFDNVELAWAELHKINKFSNKYQVKLVNLSEPQVAKLKEHGVNVNADAEKKPDEGNFIICKSQYPIRAFDGQGEEIPEDIKVANGSRARVTLECYPWRMDPSKSSASIKRLVITDLIEYNEKGSIDGDLEVL